MGKNKVTFWDRKLTYGHNQPNFGTEQGDFFGTGEVDFGSLQDALWDITICFFGTGEVDIWVITR
jgi:hypothetical protein